METYLTIPELAAALKFSVQTIQRYVLKREIPYLKIRKVIRFRPADIEEWAEKGGLARWRGPPGKAGTLRAVYSPGLMMCVVRLRWRTRPGKQLWNRRELQADSRRKRNDGHGQSH